MEQAVQFHSAGFALRGFLHVPEGAGPPRPGLLLLHGFGGSCRGAGHPELAKALSSAGYAVLRFDFRGCGQSEGQRGEVICEEEVEDARNALGFLEAQLGVDPHRIGAIGASLGGSVAIALAASDPRVKLCAANGAVGNGERRFRFQYPDAAEWQKFLARLDDAKRARREAGRATMLHRFDIVQIPEANRAGLPPGAIMEFTAETAVSMLHFNPEAVVGKIAPRPLLLVHPRGDGVVPVSETEHLAAAAGENCEKRIIEGEEHFGSGSPAVTAIIRDWLGRYMPAG